MNSGVGPTAPRPEHLSALVASIRRIARFSPYYRKVWEDAGIDGLAVRTLDDFRRLPFTTKADLAPSEEAPDRPREYVLHPTPETVRQLPLGQKLPMLIKGKTRAKAALRREYFPVFVTFTTGRTAVPVPFLYSRHDVDVLSRQAAQLFDVAQLDRNLPSVSLFPYAPHLAYWAVAFGGLETGTLVLGTGGGRVSGSAGGVAAMARMNPGGLVGTPGFVYHCLRSAADKGVRLERLTRVVLGAEKTTPALKQRLIELCRSMGAPDDVKALGTYGFTEARLAWAECPCEPDSPSGYHLTPALGHVEILDPETGEPVGDSEDGEIVFTTVAGRGSCVVRYRTGDLSRGGITHERCPGCGFTGPRLSSDITRVSNRKELELVKMKGTLVSLDDIAHVLGETPEVEEWQVVLGKKDNDPFEVDIVTLRVSAASGAPDDLANRLASRVLEATEVRPNVVEVLSLDEMIEHLGMETMPKEQRFLDERPAS